jgi:hypothetical protein
MTTNKKHALPGYDRICDQLEDAAHRGTTISVAACQMLLETAETYAQEARDLQQRNHAIEPLLVEIVAHLRMQAHFSKEARQSLIERAERILKNE